MLFTNNIVKKTTKIVGACFMAAAMMVTVANAAEAADAMGYRDGRAVMNDPTYPGFGMHNYQRNAGKNEYGGYGSVDSDYYDGTTVRARNVDARYNDGTYTGTTQRVNDVSFQGNRSDYRVVQPYGRNVYRPTPPGRVSEPYGNDRFGPEHLRRISPTERYPAPITYDVR